MSLPRTDVPIPRVAQQPVFADLSIAVHRVEVELGWVDLKMVLRVVGVWQRLHQLAPSVESNFDTSAVAESRPCLRRLCVELDTDGVVVGGSETFLGRS